MLSVVSPPFCRLSSVSVRPSRKRHFHHLSSVCPWLCWSHRSHVPLGFPTASTFGLSVHNPLQVLVPRPRPLHQGPLWCRSGPRSPITSPWHTWAPTGTTPKAPTTAGLLCPWRAFPVAQTHCGPGPSLPNSQHTWTCPRRCPQADDLHAVPRIVFLLVQLTGFGCVPRHLLLGQLRGGGFCLYGQGREEQMRGAQGHTHILL